MKTLILKTVEYLYKEIQEDIIEIFYTPTCPVGVIDLRTNIVIYKVGNEPLEIEEFNEIDLKFV